MNTVMNTGSCCTNISTRRGLMYRTGDVAMGQDRSVGIANRYGLDGPGIESRWGRGGGEIFRTRPDWFRGSPRFLYNGYRVSFPGVKRPRRGVDHPPHLAPRSKKEYSCTSTPPLGLRGLF